MIEKRKPELQQTERLGIEELSEEGLVELTKEIFNGCTPEEVGKIRDALHRIQQNLKVPNLGKRAGLIPPVLAASLSGCNTIESLEIAMGRHLPVILGLMTIIHLLGLVGDIVEGVVESWRKRKGSQPSPPPTQTPPQTPPSGGIDDILINLLPQGRFVSIARVILPILGDIGKFLFNILKIVVIDLPIGIRNFSNKLLLTNLIVSSGDGQIILRAGRRKESIFRRGAKSLYSNPPLNRAIHVAILLPFISALFRDISEFLGIVHQPPAVVREITKEITEPASVIVESRIRKVGGELKIVAMKEEEKTILENYIKFLTKGRPHNKFFFESDLSREKARMMRSFKEMGLIDESAGDLPLYRFVMEWKKEKPFYEMLLDRLNWVLSPDSGLSIEKKINELNKIVKIAQFCKEVVNEMYLRTNPGSKEARILLEIVNMYDKIMEIAQEGGS